MATKRVAIFNNEYLIKILLNRRPIDKEKCKKIEINNKVKYFLDFIWLYLDWRDPNDEKKSAENKRNSKRSHFKINLG